MDFSTYGMADAWHLMVSAIFCSEYRPIGELNCLWTTCGVKLNRTLKGMVAKWRQINRNGIVVFAFLPLNVSH